MEDKSAVAAGVFSSSSYRGYLGVDRTLLQEGANEAVIVSKVIANSNEDIADAPEFEKVFAGYDHSVFIDTSGNAYAAGWNYYGQLCFDGSDRDLPQKIEGLPQGEVAVDAAVGWDYTLILTNAGKVYGCGRNDYGQLGLGSAVQKTNAPTDIGLDGVTSVAAGLMHSFALNNDGLHAMGYNSLGQLCTGDQTNKFTPLLIAGNADVESFAAASHSSYILLTDGSVKSCGRNNYGQLGDGTTAKSTGTFVALNNVSTEVVEVYSGSFALSVFLRTQDGNIYGFGDNTAGQLGVGDSVYRNIPTLVEFDGDASVVSASRYHTLFYAPAA
jgi:alpha-tubulin suppressor-like RCC1 family protein